MCRFVVYGCPTHTYWRCFPMFYCLNGIHFRPQPSPQPSPDRARCHRLTRLFESTLRLRLEQNNYVMREDTSMAINHFDKNWMSGLREVNVQVEDLTALGYKTCVAIDPTSTRKSLSFPSNPCPQKKITSRNSSWIKGSRRERRIFPFWGGICAVFLLGGLYLKFFSGPFIHEAKRSHFSPDFCLLNPPKLGVPFGTGCRGLGVGSGGVILSNRGDPQ